MSKKDEYFTMMELQIEMGCRVDKQNGDEMSAEARVKYYEQIKAMRASDAANRSCRKCARLVVGMAQRWRGGHRLGVNEKPWIKHLPSSKIGPSSISTLAEGRQLGSALNAG